MYFVTGPDGTETGPFPIETLRQWASSGQLPPGVPIRQLGGEPMRVDRIPELSTVYLPPSSGMSALIPTSNPDSLWAYYMGYLCLVPCFGIVAVPITIFKANAAIHAYRENNAIRGHTHAVVGLILAVLGVCIQSFFVFVAIQAFSSGRAS